MSACYSIANKKAYPSRKSTALPPARVLCIKTGQPQKVTFFHLDLYNNIKRDNISTQTKGNNMNSQTNSNSSITEIAKAIREHIKEAKKANLLPPSMKVSVKCRKYAGGQSLNVGVVSCGLNHLHPHYAAWADANPNGSLYDYPSDRDVASSDYHLADWAIDALEILNKMVSEFHWDKSDAQSDYFDCNFYCHVGFDFDWTKEKKAEAVLLGNQSNDTEEGAEMDDNLIDFPAINNGDNISTMIDMDEEIELALIQLERAQEALSTAKKAKRLREIQRATEDAMNEAAEILASI